MSASAMSEPIWDKLGGMSVVELRSHVTWRELGLVLRPIDEKLRKIGDGMDLLLTERSERKGEEREKDRWLDSRRFVVTTLVVLVCGLVGSVATIVWLAVG